jgi:hypothetical protein
MRKFTALALCCFCLAVSPARAASLLYDFSFSGFVVSALETGPSISSPIQIPSIIGQTFGESFLIAVTDSGTSGFGSLTTNISGFILPVIPPGFGVSLSNTGLSYVGNASLSFLSGGVASGSIGSLAFTYNLSNPLSDVLTAGIPILSAGRADAPGTINLTLEATFASSSVSAVPLPPALPLFVSALAALGLAALRQRRSVAPKLRRLVEVKLKKRN